MKTEYVVKIGGTEVGRATYEDYGPHEGGDPTLITVERADGVLIAGIDINGNDAVEVGYWPDGEEWVAIKNVPVVGPEKTFVVEARKTSYAKIEVQAPTAEIAKERALENGEFDFNDPEPPIINIHDVYERDE